MNSGGGVKRALDLWKERSKYGPLRIGWPPRGQQGRIAVPRSVRCVERSEQGCSSLFYCRWDRQLVMEWEQPCICSTACAAKGSQEEECHRWWWFFWSRAFRASLPRRVGYVPRHHDQHECPLDEARMAIRGRIIAIRSSGAK